ncbi:MAG: NADH:ubiquinone oxidoreductase [Lentisphaerae bacterium]|nr:MAG: NADH:ubiquinone oxidoreductase [Lentisphaerota bacterium]
MCPSPADIRNLVDRYGQDRASLLHILKAVQKEYGCITKEARKLIADALGLPPVQVHAAASFYSFLSSEKLGKIVIRICNDVPDMLLGAEKIAQRFEQELGIRMGETTPDGMFSLKWTPCIGMSDQAPAIMINEVILTRVNSETVPAICTQLRQNPSPAALIRTYGDGNNAHPLIRSMVMNNIRKTGPVVFGEFTSGEALKKALAMSPQEVIRDVKAARLRGRGGAGFPTGMKWDFTRAADGEPKILICNGDEGEPGTFKDRVIFTERAHLLFEGMTIAAYAIGAKEGILYLRGEYEYLQDYLQQVLNERRAAGLLGKRIAGHDNFDFDIRIQMGAGAYICGEETALISSAEGFRGDPKNRPPFPAQKGYNGLPTCVNNVETFCCVPPIIAHGAAWFAQLGSKGSPGTKLLSISGDCAKPGIYEIEFGMTLGDVLNECGAIDPGFVQVGGPSGKMVGPDAFDQIICYDHLATGGSLMVFSKERNVLEIVRNFLEFFVDESCGYCTPCRVGTKLMLQRIEEILAGKGCENDLTYLEQLGQTVKAASRCGLGQTAANPVLCSLENFPEVYRACFKPREEVFQPTFDIRAALQEAEELAGRQSVIFQ